MKTITKFFNGKNEEVPESQATWGRQLTWDADGKVVDSVTFKVEKKSTNHKETSKQ